MNTSRGRDPGDNTVAKARENEERFAAANAQIGTAADALHIQESVPFLCECSNMRCTEIIQVSHAAYVDLKSQESTFILLTGHEDADVEQVVGQRNGYLLVQKAQP